MLLVDSRLLWLESAWRYVDVCRFGVDDCSVVVVLLVVLWLLYGILHHACMC